jgi:primosomal protein N' (replication factor Y)
MQWLCEREAGLTADDLAGLEWNWRAPARELIARGWAEWREAHEAASGEPPALAQEKPALNAEQSAAVEQAARDMTRYQAVLLDGVTGSGKTEVYLQLVERVLAENRQALVLLPEINLTPQLEARFRARFGAPLAVFHSGLNETERCRAWLSAQRGEVAILLGTRSALFTPMPRLGLIVLDEEHDASFKQQESFRFSARDAAVMRARLLNIPVVLGSATPSLESLANAAAGRYRHLRLTERAGNAAPPAFRMVDIRAQPLYEGLSATLLGHIGQNLERREQVLLFVNRRGFAPTLICHGCGWVAGCRRCDARLVVHARDRRLRCHHCGHEEVKPARCPVCGVEDLRPLGLGTERVERALRERFPHAGVARIDQDSTRRKGSLQTMLDGIHSGAVDILLGTQMLAKGHHFPNVTLAAMVDVDAGFYSTDFRAAERTAQLIVQVAGRAGRENRPGTVILQTRHPEHPLLLNLIRSGYPSFAAAALDERRAAGLPPYSHQALWRADAHNAESPQALLEQIRAWVLTQGLPVILLGPAPAPMLRQAGRFRFQLLMQSARRKPLHELVDCVIRRLEQAAPARSVRWSVDVDPIDVY